MNVTETSEVVSSGRHAAKFLIDGRQDDGTVWIERKIAVKRNSQIRVKVSFEFCSECESFNKIAGVCVYARVRNPEVEEDFAS
ncbi:MAG: hypothetical protein OEZ48_08575 [Candidatus Bathyarchaeota archaeon]|nr:hypothetical protein [Candidatus Bathyarchaeota archaeon]MDH5687900.1 hypothetical protein [Candidatus Bathyarchaeota archaeon]